MPNSGVQTAGAQTDCDLGGSEKYSLFLSFVCISGPEGSGESPPFPLLALVVSLLQAKNHTQKGAEGRGRGYSDLGCLVTLVNIGQGPEGSFLDLGAGLGGGQDGSRAIRCPTCKHEFHSCAGEQVVLRGAVLGFLARKW